MFASFCGDCSVEVSVIDIPLLSEGLLQRYPLIISSVRSDHLNLYYGNGECLYNTQDITHRETHGMLYQT